MSWENNQLNAHLQSIDDAEMRENAIQLLAEQLSAASVGAVGRAAGASAYEFSYKLLMNETCGSDEFNEMFYKIAEKLIDSAR